MLIIVDQKLPEPARKRLQKEGEVLEMYSSGITYSPISGHPDIFICQTPLIPVIAPNTPDHIVLQLEKKQIDYVKGHKNVGGKYPATAYYNAVVHEDYFVHRTDISDDILKRFTGEKMSINIQQGYTRCNLAPVNKNAFISCDDEITRALRNQGLDVLQVNTREVLLPGFKYGFFGGACGFCNNRLYIAGSLKYFKDGNLILEFAEKQGFDVIELYDGPLYDGGSILFIK